jgi:hypothetical protein
MRKLFMALFVLALVQPLFSQIPLTVLPSGGNKKASVSERIGITDVTIHYDRPHVKGREGKIWGDLIPAGFTDPGFGSSKSAPWRAGANENTTIEFNNPVMIEGQRLPAGRYGFFVAYNPNECTLIFSTNSTSWGHFFYNANEDALRVKVKPRPLDKSVEWLKYEFTDETENAAVISLQWEKLEIPFKIETDYINDQIQSFRRELRTERGFMWESWNQAAQWCVQHNVNLPEASLWADSATSTSFGGDRSFQAWTTKAQILQKMGRGEEAARVMEKALPYGNMIQVHQYARQLLGLKQPKMAFDVFKANYDKYPNQFTTSVGLARGYSAIGDYTNALKYANMALPLAPDQQNKNSVQTMIDKLKAGTDIN